MKLEPFFEKFDEFAEAPGAVEKLRQLILLLSVRGKLSIQSSQESCDLQLAKAFAFAKGNKREVQTDATAAPFIIPPNWGWTAIGHAMTLVNGIAFKPENWTTDGTPIVRIQNLNDEHAPFNHYNGDIAKKFLIRSGDFLISWSGTPGTSFGAFIWKRGLAILNQHIFRCELVDGVFIKEYLRIAVNARLDEMILRAHGAVGLRHITKGKLESIPLPLPPIAEQKRIVAKVDELMAMCDQLEVQLNEREAKRATLSHAALARFTAAPTTANLELLFHESFAVSPSNLRKTILTLAVQGKLVRQEPTDEPAEPVLRRIVTQDSSDKTTRDSESCDTSGSLPFGLPDGWSVSRLGSILQPRRGISYGVIKLGPEPIENGVYVLRCSNVRFRKIDLCGIRKVTEELSSEYGRTVLEGGEVLINVRGTLGGCAVVPQSLRGYNIAREVAMIPIHKEISPWYILNVVASPYFQDRVDENLRGIAYEGLNLGLLREFQIPIPPLAEQHRIVSKIDQLMALVDKLEAQLTASRSAAEKLMDAAVAELTKVPCP
jgi:type I restriction enzyme S subunit